MENNIQKCKCGEPLEICDNCGSLFCVVCDNGHQDENGVWICHNCYTGVEAFPSEPEIISNNASEKLAESILDIFNESMGASENYVSISGSYDAIVIAEKDAEERHQKEMQDFKDKSIEAYKSNCRRYTEHCICGDKKPCTADCEYLNDFIQALNK